MSTIKRDLELWIEEVLSRGELTPSNVVYLMAKCRQHIEGTSQHEKYKFLYFYCNWTLHTSISEATFAMRLLQEMAKVMVDFHKTTSEAPKHNDRMCELVSIAELRKNFLGLAQELTLNPKVFDSKKIWDLLVGMLMREWINKPIILVEPKQIEKYERLKKVFDEVRKATLTLGFVPEVLSFHGKGGEAVEWKILPAGDSPIQVTFEGTLNFTESQAHFSS